MNNQEMIDKLITVKTELVTLKARLTQPYLRNIIGCIEYLEMVIASLEHTEEEP